MNKQIKNDITLTLAVCLQFHGADTIIPMQRTRRANIEQYRVIAKIVTVKRNWSPLKDVHKWYVHCKRGLLTVSFVDLTPRATHNNS